MSKLFVSYIEKYRILDECQKQKIQYSFCVIVGEVEKLVSLFVFFMIMKRILPFMIVLGTLIGVRRYMGGIHFKSAMACFLASFAICSSVIWLGETVCLPKDSRPFVYIGCLLLTYLFAPLPSENRVLGSAAENYRTKAKGMLAVGILILAGHVLEAVLAQYILWALIAIQIETIIKVFMIHYKKGGEADGSEQKCNSTAQ